MLSELQSMPPPLSVPPSLPPPLSVRSNDHLNQIQPPSSFSIPATLALPPSTPLSQQAPATPSTVGVESHAQPVLQ